MGLADPLVQGILATGYTAPTEIQSEAIPAILAGKDIIACAQTGTGKTAAFVLPILNRIENVPQRAKRKKTRALIVTPTRELAIQIEKAVQGYGRFMDLKTIALYGGSSIDIQMRHLRKGIEVIVATPGRLLDLIQRGSVNLSMVEILVLDEADRMLDMGFIEDIRKIIKILPTKRQTLLFSATMPAGVKKLAQTIQKNPKTIQIGRQHNPIETITQHIYPVPRIQKMELLLHLFGKGQMYSVLIFSRTKRGADRICKRLNRGNVEAVAIHSDRTQRQRLRALDGFKRGTYRVMVATDIAARGINVEGISHVINFDVPGYVEDYVHRIGRTGRAEATGDAITFVSQDEVLNLKKIERFIECKFKPEMLDDFNYNQKVDINAAPVGKSKKSGGGRGGKGSKLGSKSGSRTGSKPGSSQRRRFKAKQGAKPKPKAGARPARPKAGAGKAKPKTGARKAKSKTSAKKARPKSGANRWSNKSGKNVSRKRSK